LVADDTQSEAYQLKSTAACGVDFVVYYGRPMEYGRPLFLSCGFFFFSSPILNRRRAGWMSTTHPHMVWP